MIRNGNANDDSRNGTGFRRYNVKKHYSRWDEVNPVRTIAARDMPGASDLKGADLRCIIHGWAFRSVTFADGRRFLRNFLLPGDLIGCAFERWPRSVTEVVAATDLECLDFVEEEVAKHPEVKARLEEQSERMLRKELALLNGIAVRMGKMTIHERVIHLFLELLERHREADLISENAFWFPIPQDLLADSLGVSKVHLNRTLQQLRKERLIRLESSLLELLDVPQMTDLVDYQSLYPESHLP